MAREITRFESMRETKFYEYVFSFDNKADINLSAQSKQNYQIS